MNLTDLQQKTLGVVSRRYKTNPITAKDIATQVGLKERDSGKDGADLRSVINALRNKGYPICASTGGYFYAQTHTELHEFITSFQARIDAQQKACNALKKSFDNVGQEFPLPTDEDVPVRKIRKGEPEIWSVLGSTGRKYDVMYSYMVYNCTCDGFKYFRKRDCIHITKVRTAKRDEIKKEQENAPRLL